MDDIVDQSFRSARLNFRDTTDVIREVVYQRSSALRRFLAMPPGVLAGSLAGTCRAACIGGNALLAIFLAFALVAIARIVAAPDSSRAAETGVFLWQTCGV
jgi:hypothetical protein